ncbi:MAG TPA: hypothetical protein VJS39_13320 [Gemmatimonadaceae bacterium]|nr:hypothetical protein [Gemmatimonadaceae bacterium]
MKVFAFTIALAGVTTAASLNAQAVPRPGTVITGTSSRRTDCSYNRTTNTVGDIIFGRTNLNTNPNTNCRDVYSREDGAWYQVGNGRSQIYERRVRDNYGYLIIQRARRNPNGTFTILNTRLANENDKQWRKEQRRQQKELRKAQHEREKELRKSSRDNGNFGIGRGDDDDHDEDDRRVDSRVSRTGGIFGVSNSERGEHGRGKGRKGRDD